MELAKNNGCGLAQTSTSVMNGVDIWQPVHRRSKYLTVRIRKIECVLADIQFQIERLQREKAYLGLVRAELGVVLRECTTKLNIDVSKGHST